MSVMTTITEETRHAIDGINQRGIREAKRADSQIIRLVTRREDASARKVPEPLRMVIALHLTGNLFWPVDRSAGVSWRDVRIRLRRTQPWTACGSHSVRAHDRYLLGLLAWAEQTYDPKAAELLRSASAQPDGDRHE